MLLSWTQTWSIISSPDPSGILRVLVVVTTLDGLTETKRRTEDRHQNTTIRHSLCYEFFIIIIVKYAFTFFTTPQTRVVINKIFLQNVAINHKSNYFLFCCFFLFVFVQLIGFYLYIDHIYIFALFFCFYNAENEWCTIYIVQTFPSIESRGIKALLCPEKTLASTLVHFIVKVFKATRASPDAHTHTRRFIIIITVVVVEDEGAHSPELRLLIVPGTEHPPPSALFQH